jgi:hypothetical protein
MAMVQVNARDETPCESGRHVVVVVVVVVVGDAASAEILRNDENEETEIAEGTGRGSILPLFAGERCASQGEEKCRS